MSNIDHNPTFINSLLKVTASASVKAEDDLSIQDPPTSINDLISQGSDEKTTQKPPQNNI